MVQGTAETAVAQRHIIRRPRLTQLLDASDARTILVVAPAGYGKTTLLREWVSLRSAPVAWFQPTAEAHDLAAVAVGLLRQLAADGDLRHSHVLQRLRHSRNPTTDAEGLVEAVVSDLANVQHEWIVIDDYHLLMAEQSIEEFIGGILQSIPVRTLIASRRRPAWVTARKVLYGAVYEVGRATLAMTREEADEVIATQPALHGLPGLVALADGWPAVIGLAALVRDSGVIPDADVPEALHEFFAEELFQSAPQSVRDALTRLSLIPVISQPIVDALFGSMAEQVTVEATRLGFLAPLPERYELHPLLRSFLRTKVPTLDSEELRVFVRAAASFYLQSALWSEALAMVAEWDLHDLAETLAESALDDFLIEGRVSEARHLIASCRLAAPEAPIVSLGEAELAFREGRTMASEPIALDAASRLEPTHPLASRLFHRAGQSAHLSNHPIQAVAAFERAEGTATNPSDLGRALWGQFVTAMELERFNEAQDALVKFQSLPLSAPEDVLRRAQARLTVAVRIGEGVDHAVDRTTESFDLLDRATDPVAVTGFLSLYANACCLTARYGRCLDAAERLFTTATQAKLDVVIPHALNMRAAGRIGLRQFAQAARDLRAAAHEADTLNDAYSLANTAALTCRLEVVTGRPDRAVAAVAPFEESELPARGLLSEVLASFAMALACAGQSSRATEVARRARETSPGADSRALQAFAAAIALDHEPSAHPTSKEQLEIAIQEMRGTGSVDSFVCAYRGYPGLLQLLDRAKHADGVRLVIENDPFMATKAGLHSALPRTPATSGLTSREKEVFGLIRRGLSNRAISQALWISESTTKVHVRRVLAKLGAKSRAEAAALAGDDLDGDD